MDKNEIISRVTSPRKTIEFYKPEYADFFSRKKHLRFRQGVFTVCFFLLCLTDQLLGSAPGQLHRSIQYFMGLVLAVILLNCDAKSGRKSAWLYLPYAVWILLFLIGFRLKVVQTFGEEALDCFGWLTGYGKNALAGSTEFIEWLFLAANIAVYGIVLIRTLTETILTFRLSRINWPFLAVWFLMLACMLFSKNEALWPLCFFLIFGCLYFTGYDEAEQSCLLNGMTGGIIAAFFVFFCFSCMFRAFDTTGYAGMYISYEKNALFHLFAHAAFLAKWYQLHREGAKTVWKVLAGFGVCLVFGYGVITAVRPVICLMALGSALTLLFLFLQDSGQWRISKTVLRLSLLLFLSALMIPCVYRIMRYVPASFYTPLVYAGESTDAKLCYWPASDSPLYTEADELAEELTGQFFSYQDEEKQEYKENRKQLRSQTRKAYLHELNLLGHPAEESSFWINDWYRATHSGNILLHMAYTYGIPAGLLFCAFCLMALCFFLLRLFARGGLSWQYFTGFLFLFAVLSYGFYDRNWSVGQLPFTLLFLVMYPVMQGGEGFPKRAADPQQ